MFVSRVTQHFPTLTILLRRISRGDTGGWSGCSIREQSCASSPNWHNNSSLLLQLLLLENCSSIFLLCIVLFCGQGRNRELSFARMTSNIDKTPLLAKLSVPAELWLLLTRAYCHKAIVLRTVSAAFDWPRSFSRTFLENRNELLSDLDSDRWRNCCHCHCQNRD